MDDSNFQETLSTDSPHSLLLSMCGSWLGICRTWFEPDKLADESQIRATIQPILSGRFIQIDEYGTLVGEAMHGLSTIGYYQERQRFEVAWVNNLHMGTGILFSTGDALDGGLSVLGEYPDPSGGPNWSWRTEVKLLDPNHLLLTAYNITPDGLEAKATEADYRRTNGKS